MFSKVQIINFLRYFFIDKEILFGSIEIDKKKILDLGCGYGALSSYIAYNYPNSKVVGIDFDKKKIEEAKKSNNLRNLIFIRQDASKFNVKDKFDVVISCDLFHHVPKEKHDKVLLKIKSMLKKGGIFIFKDIREDSFLRPFNTIHDILLNGESRLNYRRKNEWEHLIRKKLKFKILRSIYSPRIFYPHLYIVAKK